MRLYLYVPLMLLFGQTTNCWEFFHRGRIMDNFKKPFCKESHDEVEEKFINQVLDHFDPSNNIMWRQRYYINKRFYTGNPFGPVFLFIGGESEAVPDWMVEGSFIEYTKKFSAIALELEHRYYGESQPTPDTSTENLQFLTSSQALEDIVSFIKEINEVYSLDSNVKWIVFGGSYSGALAAWSRVKYPHLIHGVVSVSAPILAELDFKEYFEVVYTVLNNSDEECTYALKEAVEQLEILSHHEIGKADINKMFRLCHPIDQTTTQIDFSNFVELIADNFAVVVQYDGVNKFDEGKNNITIDTICKTLLEKDIGPAVRRLAVLNNMILKMFNRTCAAYKYTDMINWYKNDSWNGYASQSARQWLYQTCTEFGFFQTSSSVPQYFGKRFPVDLYIRQCEDIFGPTYSRSFLDASIEYTNTVYGGLDIDITNAVFVQGSNDPWHPLGIRTSDMPDVYSIYINGTSHCANLYPEADDDPPELQLARRQIEVIIGSWIL